MRTIRPHPPKQSSPCSRINHNLEGTHACSNPGKVVALSRSPSSLSLALVPFLSLLTHASVYTYLFFVEVFSHSSRSAFLKPLWPFLKACAPSCWRLLFFLRLTFSFSFEPCFLLCTSTPEKVLRGKNIKKEITKNWDVSVESRTTSGKPNPNFTETRPSI